MRSFLKNNDRKSLLEINKNIIRSIYDILPKNSLRKNNFLLEISIKNKSFIY